MTQTGQSGRLFLSDTEKHGGNYIWLTTDKQPYFLKNLNAFWKDVYIMHGIHCQIQK
jgi:hypothetical protein